MQGGVVNDEKRKCSVAGFSRIVDGITLEVLGESVESHDNR